MLRVRPRIITHNYAHIHFITVGVVQGWCRLWSEKGQVGSAPKRVIMSSILCHAPAAITMNKFHCLCGSRVYILPRPTQNIKNCLMFLVSFLYEISKFSVHEMTIPKMYFWRVFTPAMVWCVVWVHENRVGISVLCNFWRCGPSVALSVIFRLSFSLMKYIIQAHTQCWA